MHPFFISSTLKMKMKKTLLYWIPGLCFNELFFFHFCTIFGCFFISLTAGQRRVLKGVAAQPEKCQWDPDLVKKNNYSGSCILKTDPDPPFVIIRIRSKHPNTDPQLKMIFKIFIQFTICIFWNLLSSFFKDPL